MSRFLFRLHNVPEDEITDVMKLLEDHDINYYRTEAGRWYLGVAAFWVTNDDDYPQARSLLDEYQKQRYEAFSEEREALKQLGFFEGLGVRFSQDPKGFIINMAAIFMVLGLFFAAPYYLLSG